MAIFRPSLPPTLGPFPNGRLKVRPFFWPMPGVQRTPHTQRALETRKARARPLTRENHLARPNPNGLNHSSGLMQPLWICRESSRFRFWLRILIAVMATRRPAISTVTQTELLLRCRRRCAICFGLKGDFEVKDGQIAHLDRNRSNNSLDNLAWLCLPHHDDYDTIRRQTKRLTAEEVKSYRTDLYKEIVNLINKKAETTDPTVRVIIRYCDADEATSKVIAAEIMTRLEKLYQFTKSWRTEFKADLDRREKLNLTDIGQEERERKIVDQIRLQIGLPLGIKNLDQLEEPVDSDWRRLVERLIRKWAAGTLTYEQCVELYWQFEEPDQVDYHYILFGLPFESLTRMQEYGLEAFIYQHGQRKYVSLPQ